ncbi:hypothetical protein [Siphonobacter sp. SORGH_AS_0500]|uniref:hypothetical protein n=1 Tax=Siphonobacter sp. SORGH_AS_0500 TaxID=1864824 RepID=UPI00286A3492|nr:hypothetical protein [Siphonobacter sp. SORGH_AS_0500]
MPYKNVGRPTLSDRGEASRVVNFRLTQQQYDMLRRLHDSRDTSYWTGEDLTFSEMVRRILLHSPISINVPSLEQSVHRYSSEFNEMKRLLNKKKDLPGYEELTAALEQFTQRLETLEKRVDEIHLKPIAELN